MKRHTEVSNPSFSYCTGLISHQWLNFCLACSMSAAYLQHDQGFLSSFIGCSGHIESIKNH